MEVTGESDYHVRPKEKDPMADTRITEDQLAKNLMSVLTRIEEGNETFIVERNGVEVAVLRPVNGDDLRLADLRKQ